MLWVGNPANPHRDATLGVVKVENRVRLLLRGPSSTECHVAIEYLDGEPAPPGDLGASATMRSRSLGVAHTELPPLYRISQPLPKISLAICPEVITRVFSS